MNYRGSNTQVQGKIINLPACDADGEPFGRCYRVTEALFGVVPYGEEISGILYFISLRDKTACTTIDPKKTFSINDKNYNDEYPTTKILLVKRGGGCSFVRKVLMAQNAGAAAVIVMDNDYQHNKIVFMGNDGTGDDIKIPSVFVNYETGIALQAAMKTWGDNTIRASLTWSIPKTDAKVRWSLWTSAEDRTATNFKENFQLAFQRIGAKHQLFTPHFVISDGSDYCLRPAFASQKLINICGNACIYNGIYCSIKHDSGLSDDVKGRHIVQENFRQLCIFNMTVKNDRDKGTSMWWDYIDFFNEKCLDFSPACSETQMTAAGYTMNDIAAVRTCTGTASNPKSIYDYVEKESGATRNYLLDAEIQAQKDDNIFTIPSILINDFPYRGTMKCGRPPSLDSCPVVKAVCSAFKDDLLPPACKSGYCWDDAKTCAAAAKSASAAGAGTVGATGLSTGVVGAIVAGFIVLFLVIGVVVAVAVMMLKKKDQETRRYVDSVVSSYLPMKDDNEDEEEDKTGNADSTATL